MDSTTKRRLVHYEKVSVEGNEDRISNLPRSLKGYILSFLPTKNAVATSVLSTKWKYLWTSITTLDFDDGSVVVRRDPSKDYKRRKSLVVTSFINFVYRVLTRNVSDLQKFRLRCTRTYDVSHLNVWVSTALSRNLRELHLSDIIWSPPREIFTCTTLVVLRLGGTLGSLVLNVPTLVHLQSLKILVINSLRFLDDGSVYRLFSSCPLLEDLSIEECDCRNISVFNIFAPALRSLTINCRTWFDNSGMRDGPVDSVEYDSDDLGDPEYMYKFVLNTPNLQELKYKEVATEIYSVNKLNACVKADISFFQRDSRVHDGSMEKLAIAEFVERIYRVQWLYLSDNLMQFYRFPLPIFDRLTYLELGHHRTVQWKMLLDFVQSSPQLETLIFGGLAKERNQTTSRWYQLEHVPSCLLFHLKIIEIKQFSADSRELKMAKYFLNNSRVLEKLIIHPDCVSEELEICKKILMLPRRSRTCRVEVLPEMEEEEEEEEDEDEDIFAVTP